MSSSNLYATVVCKNTGTGGKFGYIEDFFKLLQLRGLARGYFPEPKKSILVVKPQFVERATAHFAPMGLQIQIGTRYLREFVGTVNKQAKYVEGKNTRWTNRVCRLASLLDPPI